MKLTAEINHEQLDVEIERGQESDELLRVKVGGQSFAVNVREPEPGVYVLFNGSTVYECRVTPDADGEVYEVNLRNRAYRVSLADPKRLRRGAGAGRGNQATGAASIKAPMPGKVLRVLVEKGAWVEAGDAVVVVEAMKMQNELKAPQAGVVSELRVEAGATVNAGDMLAIIEQQTN